MQQMQHLKKVKMDYKGTPKGTPSNFESYQNIVFMGILLVVRGRLELPTSGL